MWETSAVLQNGNQWPNMYFTSGQKLNKLIPSFQLFNHLGWFCVCKVNWTSSHIRYTFVLLNMNQSPECQLHTTYTRKMVQSYSNSSGIICPCLVKCNLLIISNSQMFHIPTDVTPTSLFKILACMSMLESVSLLEGPTKYIWYRSKPEEKLIVTNLDTIKLRRPHTHNDRFWKFKVGQCHLTSQQLIYHECNYPSMKQTKLNY